LFLTHFSAKGLTSVQLPVAAAQQDHRDERPGEQGHAGAV